MQNVIKEEVIKMSQREIRNRIAYFNCCIQAFAEKFKLNGAEAYRYLHRFKGLDFLHDFYDIEHTFSIEESVADLITVCLRNGGKLA